MAYSRSRVRTTSACASVRRAPSVIGAVGEERRCERPHRRDNVRCALCLRLGEQRSRRVPCVSLHRQRAQRALDDRSVAAPVHDPPLPSVRLCPQPDPRCRAVPQHILASVRRGERARARHRDLRSVRHLPSHPVRISHHRRVAGAPSLGNPQGTPGNEAGFEIWKCRKCWSGARREFKSLRTVASGQNTSMKRMK